MNPAQQKAAVKTFVNRWLKEPGNEEEQSRSFWIEFLALLGLNNATHLLQFETKVKGRKIDVFYEDMGILIEQKSRGVSLDEATIRSKKAGPETPYQQAKWYADNLAYSRRPRWIITCNFDTFRIYNLDQENPESHYTEISLEELPNQIHLFGFFTDKSNSRIEKEKELSVQAGAIVGKLHEQLSAQYQNIETDPHEQRSLNVLIVRLVFLLYAEDSKLINKDSFLNYLKSFAATQMRSALINLFKILDTPKENRDPYTSPELLAFPYINGGLFAEEDIVIPQFTEQARHDLLLNASQEFDWSGISPTIFGAAFESTLNPETRRAGGMHYTSIENIHKVIDPLFLDDLKAELAEIEGERIEKKRIVKLRIFQKKLSELTFLDPAAGSHNFLTETYISLRKLELRVIENLHGDQTSFDILENPIMININQFYAIEINDFAVAVGKTALWIAEQQMMDKTQELLPYQVFDFLPLKSNPNSVCANALRMDWNDVLPAEKCSYIIGNPPFRGARWQSPEQKSDVKHVFGDVKNVGDIDYVACWYRKAVDYIENFPVRCAFVSTNSICQGEQVANIWKPLFDRGVRFDFAHKTFVWGNETSGQAHVHVIILGFSASGIKPFNQPIMFSEKTGERNLVKRINPYLADAPDVFVYNRTKPLCDAPIMGMGSQPLDDGLYLFTEEEMNSFLESEPKAKRFFHPFTGAKEFLNGYTRYCLWLGEATEKDIEELPLCKQRIQAVREYRLKSKRKQTLDAALRPNHFGTEILSKSNSVVLPQTSSERRKYIPIGFLDAEVFCSDKVRLIPDATIYHFGILTSQIHNAWMRVVAGRLEMRYIYSNKLVYNNFVWPNPTPEQKAHIERCAQNVLDMRDMFPDKSLADLYDPDKMPEGLKNAHEILDAAVEAAYSVEFNGDEEKIVAHLFKLYAEMTEN